MQGQPQATTARDVLIGLIGRGIGLSRTPAMHVAEAKAQGMACTYRLLDMDEPDRSGMTLARMLEQVESEGYAGVNVTYPFKIEVMSLLHGLSANAAAVGAVNTVIFRDGTRIGHNTDLWGFAESFRRGFAKVARKHVLLIGAGGAGAAVAHALVACGVRRLSIYDVDLARASALKGQVADRRTGTEPQVIVNLAALVATDRPDGIVNATPMGMAKLPGTAFPVELLDPSMWVADIVYFPLETALLKAARARGCRTLSGSGMAVFQAVRAFELFTGWPADPDRMTATFESFDADQREALQPKGA